MEFTIDIVHSRDIVHQAADGLSFLHTTNGFAWPIHGDIPMPCIVPYDNESYFVDPVRAAYFEQEQQDLFQGFYVIRTDVQLPLIAELDDA